MQRDQLEAAARKRNLRCPDESTLDAWSEAVEELNFTAAEAIRKLEVFMLNRQAPDCAYSWLHMTVLNSCTHPTDNRAVQEPERG